MSKLINYRLELIRSYTPKPSIEVAGGWGADDADGSPDEGNVEVPGAAANDTRIIIIICTFTPIIVPIGIPFVQAAAPFPDVTAHVQRPNPRRAVHSYPIPYLRRFAAAVSPIDNTP